MSPSKVEGEEVFLPIPGFDGYQVSNFGRFKKSSGKDVLPQKTSNGYLRFSATISGKRVFRLVHRIVAEVFIGPINGMEINHKDFDKKNNHVSNLEIVTHAENQAHYKGSNSAKAAGLKISKLKTKYTPQEIAAIKKKQAKARRIKLNPNPGAHGGPNRNQGRRAPDGKRTTISVCLTPENTAFLKAMGNQKNNWLNLILDRERLTETKI